MGRFGGLAAEGILVCFETNVFLRQPSKLMIAFVCTLFLFWEICAGVYQPENSKKIDLTIYKTHLKHVHV